MSVTYQLIIDTLCSNKYDFSNNENIISKDFKEFSNMFTDDFYRIGVYRDNNNSIWTSLLVCLDENYFTYNKNIIISQITNLKAELYNYASYNKMPKRFYNDIDKNIISSDVFTVMCKYLNINVIIFDMKENKIKCQYDGDFMNPYKNTVLLANFENDYEPIITNDVKYFNYTREKSKFFKYKILTSDIECMEVDKIFTIVDNVNDILDKEEIVVNETFTTTENVKQELSKNKLQKMKKDQIIELLNDINVKIPSSKMTKAGLIDLYFSQ